VSNEFFIAQEDAHGVIVSAASFTVFAANKILIKFHDGKERILKREAARAEWMGMIEQGWNMTESETYEECVRAHLGRRSAPKPTRFALGKKNPDTGEVILVTDFFPEVDGQISVVDGDGKVSRVTRSSARLCWRDLIADGWVEIPFRVAIGVRNRIRSHLAEESSGKSYALNRMGDVRSHAVNPRRQKEVSRDVSGDGPEELKPYRHIDDNWDFDAIK
jgi:hypothetical protein